MLNYLNFNYINALFTWLHKVFKGAGGSCCCLQVCIMHIHTYKYVRFSRMCVGRGVCECVCVYGEIAGVCPYLLLFMLSLDWPKDTSCYNAVAAWRWCCMDAADCRSELTAPAAASCVCDVIYAFSFAPISWHLCRPRPCSCPTSHQSSCHPCSHP